jgi:hypothetical protein
MERNFKIITKSKIKEQDGRIGYLVLWFLGAPVGLLIFLWVVLGDNIFGAG